MIRRQFTLIFAMAAALVFLLEGPAASGGRIDARQSLKVAGVERTFRVHVPPGYDGARAMPLLLFFHGGGGQGAGMAGLSGMNQVSDRGGFLVVYPDGLDRHWNDGREVVRGADDDAFVSALIQHLCGKYKVDRSRIYACGISNGGFYSEHLACVMADQIAAIALVAATMSDNAFGSCHPGRTVPVMFILGVDDPLVPWQGGTIGFKPRRVGVFRAPAKSRGTAVSAARAVAFWVHNNGCATTPDSSLLPDHDRRDGTRVRQDVYAAPTSGADVVLYGVEGGGHTWPGGRQYLPERIIGRTTRDINASEVIWEFFQRHSLK